MISANSFTEEDGSSSVYDKLAGIRSAFEILIEKYGYDEIALAMGRVVEVLEEFEQLAAYKRQSKLQLVNCDLRLEEEKESREQEVDNYRFQARQLQEAKKAAPKVPEDQADDAISKLNDVIEVQNKQRDEMKQEYEELNLRVYIHTGHYNHGMILCVMN
eukprot:sb/3472895/